MQKARRHVITTLRPLVGRRVQGLFHSPARGSFHLSLTVLVAVGLSGVFSLTGWAPLIHARFLVPRATQDATRLQSSVVYGVFTLYDRLFQGVPLDSILPRRGPTTPVSPRRHGFGLFRVRSPLLTESLFIFSSYGYLDVSVPHVRLPYGMTGLQPAGLPHSDIPGSRAICASPGLFAAYHVLRRLREPRHPPSALAYFLSPRT